MAQVKIDSYITCVATELNTMIQVYDKKIIPRCIELLNKNEQKGLQRLNKYFNSFEKAFDQLLEAK